MSQQNPDKEYLLELIYQFIGSLTLCEHMGDVCNDIGFVLKQLDSDIKSEDWSDLDELMDILAKRGITTLYNTSLGADTDEEPEGSAR